MDIIETIDLLVRFKEWLHVRGEAVGDTDRDTAEAFLRETRADDLRELVAATVPDPRFI